MKVFILASEFPFPANHGAKVDIWNRILAFNKIGLKVFLLSWYQRSEEPGEEDLKIVNKYVEGLAIYPIQKGVKRILGLAQHPLQVAGRKLDKQVFSEVLDKVKQFSPDLILIDSLYGGYTGLKLAEHLTVPVVYRSHNVEYKYMHGLLKRASGIKAKLALGAMCLHLKSFEWQLLGKVDSYYSISINDLEYFKQCGFLKGYWLPPMANDTVAEDNLDTEVEYHVGFIGNLYSQNNVEGIRWFINSVVPILKKQVANLKCVLIGSQPVDEIVDLCSLNGIQLFKNVKDTRDYVRKINVLINPVKFGSGVNIKSIDMLSFKNQIVSTSVGVVGLPEEIKDVFFIADTENEFSATITDILLNNKKKDIALRERFRKLFQPSMIKDLLPVMLTKTTQV